ncbi:MAG: 50S ribosomal protein L1 [Patescibacteria group bacterium]
MSKSGKRYTAARSKIEPGKRYNIKEAVELLKQMPATKFDQSVEIHFKLGVDTKQANQQVRGFTTLPHGLGKLKKVAVFCEEANEKEAKAAGATIVGGDELIKIIATTGKCDFDVAVATPGMMKKMAPIAKILGQKGLMPNPKTETITPDVGKVVQALNSGKISFKVDESGNVHQMIGKMSFDAIKLQENAENLLQAIRKAKPTGVKGTYLKNAVLTCSMGPAIPLVI